jgi:cytochrome b pre-mRNA-processing protein 3
LSLFQRIFGDSGARSAWAPLYHALVARGRDPFWYQGGGVPDTLDGRFDMVAAMVALALIRLEAEGAAGRAPIAFVTELFVEDMDGTLRQIGIGDYVVGKHVGRMMGALGGRLAAFRAARSDGGWEEAVRRNIYHDAPPTEEAVAAVATRLADVAAALDSASLEALREGALP